MKRSAMNTLLLNIVSKYYKTEVVNEEWRKNSSYYDSASSYVAFDPGPKSSCTGSYAKHIIETFVTKIQHFY